MIYLYYLILFISIFYIVKAIITKIIAHKIKKAISKEYEK